MHLAEIKKIDLPSEVVIRYLQAHAWKSMEPEDSDIAVLRKVILSQEEEIVLPRYRGFADYQQRVFEGIEAIAKYENRPFDEVFEDLVPPQHDVLRIRIHGDHVGNGWISYLDKRNIEEGLRKILLAAACFVVDPKSYYKKLHRAEAEKWIQTCRSGTPEAGSYILKLQFPLAKDVQGQFFTRKVTECLMMSLNRLVSFVENLSLEEEKLPDLNANLCLGLAEMKPDNSSVHFDFDMKWSRLVPVKESIPMKVTVKDDYFSAITKIGQKLKPKEEITQDFFTGTVASLQGVPDGRGGMEGYVTLSLQMDEELIKARVLLNSKSYAVACDAHKQNRYIRISGTLRETPHCSDLENVVSFEMIQK